MSLDFFLNLMIRSYCEKKYKLQLKLISVKVKKKKKLKSNHTHYDMCH